MPNLPEIGSTVELRLPDGGQVTGSVVDHPPGELLLAVEYVVDGNPRVIYAYEDDGTVPDGLPVWGRS